ncbi:MAG: hypothetical protein H0W27_08935 [Actinobacteria bacterium]|nr:hypothetical protein [Actinomycetota bacterium]
MAAEPRSLTRRRAFVVASAIAFVIMAVRVPGGPLAAAAGCDPEYDPRVSTPEEVIPRYPHREATTDEIYRYFEVVDSESDRVENGVYGTSWLGRPLIYSLVTDEDQLPNVAAIAADQQRLRDPRRTTPEEAARIAAENPAIAWYAANVHGGEESGGDASLQILYELAARIDCEAEEMLRELVVGIIPTQNPDGRDLNTRQNAYGFDMNRDWFARTQPEIDAEMDLLREYPPVVFVDAHENNGTSFFFPPNADPVHHEISEKNIDWIYHMYGPALAAEFQQRGWRYYNHDGYDFFAMEYGDTVPTTVFMSAGMTFEKGNNDTAYDRWLEQWVAGWTTLETAAENREDILREYYDAYVTALEEGEAGELEPNRTYQPGQELDQQVPNLAIRHYFLPPETSRAHPETATLVERLLDTDVEVYRLERNLSVPDLQFYGRTPSAGTVPAGSFWIPMAQPQKHWIQALLGEDPYISVFGSYDVTSWSNPLLLNLDASFSGAQLDPAAKRVLEPPEGTVAGDPGSATYFWFPGDSGRAVAAALLLERSGGGS